MRMAILIVLALLFCGCSQEASTEVAYSAVIAAIESTQADIEKTVDLRARARDMITKEGWSMMDAGTVEKCSESDRDMIKVYTETTQWLKDYDDKKGKLIKRKAEIEKRLGL